MAHKKIAAAATMVVLLLATGISLAQVAGPDAMVKGIEFTRAVGDSYSSYDAQQSLEELRATGANWVTIVPVYWMSDTGADHVFGAGGQTPTDSEVTQVIRWAKQLGLKVFMKPEVHCLSGVWQGYHTPHSASWFQSYWAFIRHYARLAQWGGCEMFCVGSELDRTTEITGSGWGRTWWPYIINGVRGEYFGPVTYAADWRTYRNIPFWDSLDLIGINAYFPPWVPEHHPPPQQVDVQNLAEEWKLSYIPEIEAFRDSLDLADTVIPNTVKPIIFTEIGYRSISGCAAEPWNDTTSGAYDPTEQRNCYIAALHSLLGKPWFAGWFWHEWTTDPNQGGTGDLSYTPKGKPAQEVLRRWFASIGTQKSAEMPCFERYRYGYPRTDSALISLAAHNANWTALVGLWVADSLNEHFTSIESSLTWTPTDASLRDAIGFAHERGLNVMLKAQVCGPGLGWQGQFDPSDDTIDVRDVWFDEFTDFVAHYAAIAEEENCEMFCTGVEIDPTTDDPGEAALWASEVMPAVREAYSGPVVYAALHTVVHDGALWKPRIWSLTDFAGIDAYFPLFPAGQYVGIDTAPGQTPDTADLRWNTQLGWEYVRIPQLKALYDSIQKPIVFPEIGYRSIDSTAFYTSSNGDAGWRRQESGVTDDLRSVCFPVDTVTGYVVGDGGTILKTTNSGETWGTCNSGTSCGLYSVDFPVADTGYAVGQAGTILKTTDGWASHENRAELGMQGPYRSVCFPRRPDTGYVVGDGGVVLKTTNGGNSWTRLHVVLSDDTVRSTLFSVCFPQNTSTGCIVGDSGLIAKTTDGGATWLRESCVVNGSMIRRALYSVDFAPNALYACAVGDSATYIETTDGGGTWSLRPYEGWDPTLLSVCAAGGESTFVSAVQGCLLRTGRDWPLCGSRQIMLTGEALRGIQVHAYKQAVGADTVANLVGFVVGDGGTIQKTSTGGRMRVTSMSRPTAMRPRSRRSGATGCTPTRCRGSTDSTGGCGSRTMSRWWSATRP